MNLESKTFDRLQRLLDSATRFEKCSGGRRPVLHAKMAQKYLLSGNILEALRAIINAENEMRVHELRELAMKSLTVGGELFLEVMSAIQDQDLAHAEEILIAAGALD